MSQRFMMPFAEWINGSSAVQAGAKLFFYTTGTSTPQNTYSDSALTVANTNPVVADSDGRFGDIFLSSANYKVVLQTSAGVQIWSADPVSPPSAADTWAVAGGSADALTATYSPAIASLTDGQLCFVRAASANATTTPTFSPSGLTARVVTKLGGVAVAASEWTTDQELILRYKLASTRWELLNPTVIDADLAAIAALTHSRGRVIVSDGTNWSFSDHMMGRNRIINGDMRFDQRNAGALMAIPGGAATYTVDRWAAFAAAGAKFTVQQSALAPDGFSNSAAISSVAATAPAAGDQYTFTQPIEGVNIVDLAWGTASAKSVVVSFWARSTLTGTFGFQITNSAAARSYIGQYTINAANTWEFKVAVIPGDTAGAWLATTGIGLNLTYDLGSGSTFEGAASAWQAGNVRRIAGNVRVIGTNGASLLLTGVQAEAGGVGSPFERRHFTTEITLCQRYYCKTFPLATAPAEGAGLSGALSAMCPANPSEPQVRWQFPVEMRTAPTIALFNPRLAGTDAQWDDNSAVSSANARALLPSTVSTIFDNTDTTLAGNGTTAYYIHATASAEL